MNFQNEKKQTLEKKDKSTIGEIDKKIVGLCDKINSLDDYYTTSSCAGRVKLVRETGKKEPDLFVWVSHEVISFDELKGELDRILNEQSPSENLVQYDNSLSQKQSPTINPPSHPLLGDCYSSTKLINKSSVNSNKKIYFKQEPCILHVACKNFDSAMDLLKKAQLSGWKRSGLIDNGKFVLELLSTEKMELPIIKDGKILVDDDYLKLIVDEANDRVGRVWGKIQRLETLISRISS
ncbi:MAG: hypothetical protein KKF56_04575 [Nanoarchaeota archaeon]|nr:hypothetical protein [Nanoarchaeota archaeon]